MVLQLVPHPPLAAARHRAALRRRGGAVGLLTVYIVLLFAVPSNASIVGLGSLGRPAVLWGLVLLIVWCVTKLQTSTVVFKGARHPVRLAIGLWLVLALVSAAVALMRGQPADQAIVPISYLVRLLAWAGVVLVALDGVTTRNELTKILRRVVIAASCLAVLGLAQFATGQTLLDWVSSVPGLEVSAGGVEGRATFTRAAGTAIHPLEFTATIAACVPLSVATAVAGGYVHRSQWRWAWWIPPVLLLGVSTLSVSRSAMIGLVVAAVASVPSLPRAYRWLVAVGGLGMLIGIVVVVPGLYRATMSLFVGAADDASTQSRSTALERLPDFVSPSPVIGVGPGTFMSRYYIFDDQWAITLIDMGVLGVLALLFLVGAAVWSAVSAGRRSTYLDAHMSGRAIAAAVLTMAVLFLFFDGFGFPIAGGFFFFLLGLAAAVRNVGIADGKQQGRGGSAAGEGSEESEPELTGTTGLSPRSAWRRVAGGPE